MGTSVTGATVGLAMVGLSTGLSVVCNIGLTTGDAVGLRVAMGKNAGLAVGLAACFDGSKVCSSVGLLGGRVRVGTSVVRESNGDEVAGLGKMAVFFSNLVIVPSSIDLIAFGTLASSFFIPCATTSVNLGPTLSTETCLKASMASSEKVLVISGANGKVSLVKLSFSTRALPEKRSMLLTM